MADDVSGLVLTVGADISPVEQALNEIPAVAQQAGAAIDAALSGGFDAAAASLVKLNDALSDVGTGAGGGLAELDAAVEDTGRAAGDAVPHLEDLGKATHEAGEAAHEAAIHEDTFGEKMMELASLAGIVITLEAVAEAIKHIATEAIEAFAASEKFTTAMTQLTGSVKTAEETLAQLKTTALQLPVSLESLEQATQRMQAFGIATEKIPEALTAAANAAAATGNSFDTVAQALARVEVTGQLSARQLVQLGISWKDLAQTMGVSIQEAQELLKKGGQDAEADVEALLHTIEQKFSGASAAMGQTLAGQFQLLKNQLDQVLESIGEGAAPALRKLMDIVGSDVVPAIQGAIEGFKALAEVVGPVLALPIGELLHSFTDLASVTGNVGTIIAGSIGYFKSLADSISGTTDSLAKLWGLLRDISPLHALATVTSAAASSFKDLSPATALATLEQQRMQSVTAALTSQLGSHHVVLDQVLEDYNKQKQALADAQTHLEKITQAYNDGRASAGQLAEATTAVAKAQQAMDPQAFAARLQAVKDAHNAAAAAAKAQQQALDDWAKGVHEATEAANKLAVSITDYAKQHKDAVDQITGDASRWIEIEQKRAAATEDADKQTVTAFKDMVKSEEDLIRSNQDLQANFDSTFRSIKEATTDQVDITVKLRDRVGELTQSYAQMAGQMHEAGLIMQADFDKEIARLQSTLDLMTRFNHPLTQRLALQEEILTKEEAYAVSIGASGKSVLALAEDLEKVHQKHVLIQQDSVLLAQTYTRMLDQFGKAWDDLGKGIADAAVSTQDFGKVATQVLDNLKKSLMEDVVHVLMTEVKNAFLENTDALGGFTKVFNAFFGAGGDMAKGFTAGTKAATDFGATVSDSMKSATDSMNSAAQSIQQSTQQLATSVHSSASSMLADFNLIATAIGAIASIFSAIELAHTNTLLGRIEESTRRLDITTEGILAQSAQVIIEQLPKMDLLYHLQSMDVNVTSLLSSISVTLDSALQVLELIAANGGGGGQGGGADNNAIIAAINASAASQAGMLGQLMNAVVTAGSSGTAYTGGGGTSRGGGYYTVINSVPGVGGNIVPGVALPGVGSGGTAVITPTGLPASTIPGVGQAAGNVGSGTNVVISPVINAQGAVFGTGGVQSLATTVGNIVMDNFRRAGMRF